MTLTLTAVQDFSGAAPRIKLDLSSTLLGSEWVSIMRTHEDGESYKVIMDSNSRLSSGLLSAAFDYHPPFEQELSYVAVTANETSNAVVVTARSTTAWLCHASDPTLSIEVAYIPEDGLGDDDVADGSGVFTIRGSNRPAVVWDDTVSITSSVRLGILPEQQSAVLKLARSGGPLLLNIPKGLDVDWRWIQPKLKINRGLGKTASGGSQGYPYRMIEIGYTWVRQPDVDVVPEWSYADLNAAFPTLQASMDAYATIPDLVADKRI